MTPVDHTLRDTGRDHGRKRITRPHSRLARTRTRFQRSSDRVVSAWLRDLAASGTEAPERTAVQR